MFTPDFDKKKFEIVIEVYDSGNLVSVKPQDGYKPGYQEFIGALEGVKLHYVFNQIGVNAEAYRQWQQKQNPRKNAKTKSPKPPETGKQDQ